MAPPGHYAPIKKPNTGLIIGLVVGGLVLVLLIGAVVWLFVANEEPEQPVALKYGDGLDSCETLTDPKFTGGYTELIGGGMYVRSDEHNSGNSSSRLDCGYTSNDPEIDDDVYQDSLGIEVTTRANPSNARALYEGRQEYWDAQAPEAVELPDLGESAFYIAELTDNGRWTVDVYVLDRNLYLAVNIQTVNPAVTEDSAVDMLTGIAAAIMPEMEN